ncbi:PepSY-like domain-containing protein [Salinimicrobium soli]|uniref:PepSY-like domain-containing protein n=1 Tax=Salinimicrobium soli TaxID=1254399 RepID=UPI003AB0915C
MNKFKFSMGLLGVFMIFQACSESDDTTEPNLNAVAFSADTHVRTATLPQSILDYVTENYPGLTIIEAEIEDNQNYEVYLSDHTELVFNSQGEFLGVDDDDNEFGDEDIDPSALPQNILDFINKYYPGATIEEAELENNGHYEIELSNDVELIFDGNGNFLGQAQDENDDDQGENEEDIDPSQLPQAILDYIALNYAGTVIIEAEMDDDGYEVTLNNGVELEFDQQGNFLSAEDGNGEDEGEDD